MKCKRHTGRKDRIHSKKYTFISIVVKFFRKIYFTAASDKAAIDSIWTAPLALLLWKFWAANCQDERLAGHSCMQENETDVKLYLGL